MSDIQFIDGLRAKAPRDGAPDFVKASLSIKREELIAWLQERDDVWVNADIKESKSGNWYVTVNASKPNSDKPARQVSSPAKQAPADSGFSDDEIPF